MKKKNTVGLKYFIIAAILIFTASGAFFYGYGFLAAMEKENDIYRVKYYTPVSYDDDRSDYSINIDGLAKITILINGERANIYRRRGQYYIEGREGRNYSILINGKAGERIKLVASIDGLDIIDGKSASYGKAGYVINPYSYVNIKGWRISDNEVASFKFGPIEESYAMKMDKPSEIGVMSFAFFREKSYDYVLESDYSVMKNESSRQGGTQASSAPAGKLYDEAKRERSQSIGTEFGRRRDSRVSHTEFEPASADPEAIIKINYASYEDLVKKGILGGRDIIVNDEKKASENQNYCRPPESWRK